MASTAAQYNPKFLAGGLWHQRRRVPLILCALALMLLLVSTAAHFSTYLYQARKVSGHWMFCHLLALMGYYDCLTDRVV